MRTFPIGPLILLLSLAGFAGCRSAYYDAMEAFGVHKRDILVDRVEEARDEQTEAKEQFQSALARFKALTGFQGGDLEKTFEKLNDEYEDCESQAKDVGTRIDAVEDVSEAMFAEWKQELKEYSDPGLRNLSESKLKETRKRCGELLTTMRKAEKSMAPVLSAFKDRVLFLKHNLNAQAIASLQGQVVELEGDVGKLVEKMETSIREANEFIESLPKS